jgi:hypothetical protein
LFLNTWQMVDTYYSWKDLKTARKQRWEVE